MRAVMHSYSLTGRHVVLVKLMAAETGLSEGLIVRNAIDLLQEQYAHMGKVSPGRIFRKADDEEIPVIHRVTRISDLIEG